MMNSLSQILFLFCLCWIAFAVREMAENAMEIWRENRKVVPWIIDLLRYVLTCAKCFSFWISLVISMDLTTAVVTSICMDVYFSIRLRYL